MHKKNFGSYSQNSTETLTKLFTISRSKVMPRLISKLIQKIFPSQSQSVEYEPVFGEEGFKKLYSYVDTDFIQNKIDEVKTHIAPLENQSFFDYEKAYILDIVNNIDKVDIGEQLRILEVINDNMHIYNIPKQYKPLFRNFIDHLTIYNIDHGTSDVPMKFTDIAGMNALVSDSPEMFVAKMAMFRICVALFLGENHHLTATPITNELARMKINSVHRYEEASLYNKTD